MRGRDRAVISLVGDVTWETTPQLRERLGELVEAGTRQIVLNLAGVSFVDSSGLATILAAYRRQRARGAEMTLVNVPEPVMRALRQARLAEVLPVHARRSTDHDCILTTPAQEPRMVRTTSLPSDPAVMAQTRAKVSSLYESLGLSKEDVFDLTLAFGEALGNAFDHGCPGADDADAAEAMVTVSVALYDDRIVTEVTDCGCGASFEQGDDLPAPTETRGRGIRLMTMLADGVSIRPKSSGHGTVVRLVKLLGAPPADCEDCIA